MQYRLDARTGKELSILGFGVMRLPTSRGRIDMDKSEAMLLESFNKGINFYDTAYIYPGSETALGQFIAKNSLRDKIYIATKMPLFLCRNYSDFDKYFNKQLERLKTDYIDYYFMHSLNSHSQWQELCDMGMEKWISEKKAQGKIHQIGFSFHGSYDDFIAITDSYDWEFCMIQYNYSNINYQAGIKGMRYAASKGLPVIIMEPLLGGRLATGLPTKAVDLLKASNPALSPAAWGLKWVWNHKEVTVLLSGMSNISQLSENIATAGTATADMLTKRELDTIDKVVDIFNASYKVPCTGCNYCVPCPVKVDIPGCFAAYNTSFAFGKFAGLKEYAMSTGAFFSSQGSASTCIMCGKCEPLCPQNIPIREHMAEVSKRMEPLWYKAIVAFVQLFMKKRAK